MHIKDVIFQKYHMSVKSESGWVLLYGKCIRLEYRTNSSPVITPSPVFMHLTPTPSKTYSQGVLHGGFVRPSLDFEACVGKEYSKNKSSGGENGGRWRVS